MALRSSSDKDAWEKVGEFKRVVDAARTMQGWLQGFIDVGKIQAFESKEDDKAE